MSSHCDFDLHFPNSLVKAMVFPVVMYGCESWTIKKAEHWRIDVFELWCWRRLLRVPWIARRSNQSILKDISPGCSLEGLMLKLKLQYFGHLIRRADSFEKTLMLGKIEGRRRGQQRMRQLDGITNSMDSGWTPGVGDGQGDLACCGSWGRKVSDTTEQLNWTDYLYVFNISWFGSWIRKKWICNFDIVMNQSFQIRQRPPVCTSLVKGRDYSFSLSKFWSSFTSLISCHVTEYDYSAVSMSIIF